MNVIFYEAFSASKKLIGGVFIKDVNWYQLEAMPKTIANDPVHAGVVQGNVFVAFYQDEPIDPYNCAGVIITPAQLQELEQKWEKGPIEMVLPHGGTDTGIYIDTPFQ